MWDSEFGDRSQELVLIGRKMDQAALVGRLEACLLTKEELEPGLASWCAAADPFPIMAENSAKRQEADDDLLTV